MSSTLRDMTAPTRVGEFTTGTGVKGVLVTKRHGQPYVHVDLDCSAATRSKIGVYPNEKMARAAIPGVKACKTCRT